MCKGEVVWAQLCTVNTAVTVWFWISSFITWTSLPIVRPLGFIIINDRSGMQYMPGLCTIESSSMWLCDLELDPP